MEDYRNREWTVPAHELKEREREEQKQLMKEAFKEALEEAGVSNTSSQQERHNSPRHPNITPSYEELLKRIGF